jgi:AraC-like DNA-binding protein
MEQVTVDAFLRAPAGRWAALRTALVWCHSPSLCGAACWGRPGPDDAREILAVFDAHERILASQYDFVVDSRGTEVDADALAYLIEWLTDRRDALRRRVRMQAGIVDSAPHGFMLAGLFPAIGDSHPFRVFTDASEAFRHVAPDVATELCAEVDELVARARQVPHALRVLREMLAARPADTSMEKAARALALSPRSFQRLLTAHHTSFRDEVIAARFTAACALLATTDAKIASVSARLGVSERALELLFRERAGMTPAEWRKRQRS